MAGQRCRQHPDGPRRVKGSNGLSTCVPCERAWHQANNARRPGGRDGWGDPVADAEEMARFAAWSAGLILAIAEMRHFEGFDGRERAWQTLGECLLPEPAQVHQQARRARPVVACQRCGSLRFASQEQCAACYELARRRSVLGRMAG